MHEVSAFLWFALVILRQEVTGILWTSTHLSTSAQRQKSFAPLIPHWMHSAEVNQLLPLLLSWNTINFLTTTKVKMSDSHSPLAWRTWWCRWRCPLKPELLTDIFQLNTCTKRQLEAIKWAQRWSSQWRISYLFLRMITPKIILAISDPCRDIALVLLTHISHAGVQEMLLCFRSTYWSEDHVQRHSNVEVECVVIDYTDGEEHGHHDHIVTREKKKTGRGVSLAFYLNLLRELQDQPDGDHGFLPAKVRLEDESFQGDEQKLSKGNQVATSWKLSEKRNVHSQVQIKL